MTELPRLSGAKQKTKKYTYAFGGINLSESFSVGEFETSENISFDSFPAISAGRARDAAPVTFDSAYEYIPVNGGAVAYKYDSAAQTLTLAYLEEKSGAVLKGTTTLSEAAEGRREAARVGNYVVVFPDKRVLKLDKIFYGFKPMEQTFEIAEGDADISNGSIKFSTGTLYESFESAFAVGDVITINGGWYHSGVIGGRLEDKKVILRSLDDDRYTAYFDPYCFEIQKDGLEMWESRFTKTVPDLKNLVCFEGRVWGNDADGKIYASKFSDPTNFEYFDLSSADSFSLETETPGEFTASAAPEGHVAFFKEDKIHRITGTKPANFRHTVVYTNGVKSGAEKTLKEKDGTLYYVGTDGIYVYSGAEARRISESIGALSYESGAAVFYKDLYYIGMKSSGADAVYAYDTQKGMWLRDGEELFKNGFKFLGKACYADSSGAIKALGGGKNTARDMSVTLREITGSDAEQKGWSRLYIEARMSEGDKIKAEANLGGGFETVGVFTDFRKRVFEIRLAPNRGDKLRLRLTASPSVVITRLMREHYTHGSVF